jgi:hypothetical protein
MNFYRIFVLYMKYNRENSQLRIIYFIDKYIFENVIIIYCFTFYRQNSKFYVQN